MANQYTTVYRVSPGVTVSYNPEQEYAALRWECSHDAGVDCFPTRESAIGFARGLNFR